MNAKVIAIILGGGALLFAGAYVIEQRVGSTTNLPSIDHLIQSQPTMPDMNLPKLGSMPDIEGIAGWINSPPLTREDLKGKVVLVDFWTYSCINCIRTFPYLKDWWAKYKDHNFVLLGVHTPEFAFEKEMANVQKAATDFGLTYPIALDNEYTTWQNFSNRFWPAHYLFDQNGDLRYVHFGEGEYDKTEKAIQELVGVTGDLSTGVAPTPQFDRIRTPETYFGWGREERFSSPEPLLKDRAKVYSFPQTLPLNQWALEGDWIVTKEHAELASGTGSFRFRYNAGAVHLVIDTADRKQTFADVKVDGKYITKDIAGKDTSIEASGRSFIEIEYPKAHTIVDGPSGDHVLEVTFTKPGAQVFAITFGANE